jgi:protein transport protein YIF1
MNYEQAGHGNAASYGGYDQQQNQGNNYAGYGNTGPYGQPNQMGGVVFGHGQGLGHSQSQSQAQGLGNPYHNQPPAVSPAQNFDSFATASGVNPQMLGLAARAGKGTIDNVVSQMTPGMSNFWLTLKLHFAVDNSYVFKKISIILFPFRNKKWARASADDGQNGQYYTKALPKHDYNAPDLYLPLMSFITYVLLVGYVKGTENQFTPEDLINAVWRCLLLQLVESSIIKVGLNVMNANIVSFLDVVSYTGYKYVGLCGTVLAFCLGGWIFTLFTFYQAFALFFFTIKTFKEACPKKDSIPPRWVMISSFAGIEAIVSLFLAYL